EQFLRTNYRYSTVVKSPPSGRDPVDWFLFDLREDFCEYFASSMVVMLRTQGIPARIVEGFTAGVFDQTTGKYVVSEKNAHAWVGFELRFRGLTPAEAAFGKMRLLAAYAGLRQRPHQTVNEYAGTLGRALPRARSQIAAIAHARVIESYSRRTPSASEAQAAR